jgi:hypothetical protein
MSYRQSGRLAQVAVVRKIGWIGTVIGRLNRIVAGVGLLRGFTGRSRGTGLIGGRGLGQGRRRRSASRRRTGTGRRTTSAGGQQKCRRKDGKRQAEDTGEVTHDTPNSVIGAETLRGRSKFQPNRRPSGELSRGCMLRKCIKSKASALCHNPEGVQGLDHMPSPV